MAREEMTRLGYSDQQSSASEAGTPAAAPAAAPTTTGNSSGAAQRDAAGGRGREAFIAGLPQQGGSFGRDQSRR